MLSSSSPNKSLIIVVSDWSGQKNAIFFSFDGVSLNNASECLSKALSGVTPASYPKITITTTITITITIVIVK